MKSAGDFTPQQLAAIRHIRNWLMRRGRTPSVRELMADLSYKSPKSVQDILEQLRSKRVIKKLNTGGYQLMMDTVAAASPGAQTVSVPVVGSAACGLPMLAEENIEGYLSISTKLAKPDATYYLLRARGDSMNNAGIDDGDLVLVRQQETARPGDKVVALIDSEATIKEYHLARGMVLLMPRSTNPRHRPIVLTADFRVQGVVVAVIPSVD